MKLSQKLKALTNCRLCLKITLATFLSIVIIEIFLLLPVYTFFKSEVIADRRSDGYAIMDSLLTLHDPKSDQNQFVAIANKVTQGTILKGALIYDNEGKLITSFGKVPEIKPEILQNINSYDLQLLDKPKKSLYAYWNAKELEAPYNVLATIDLSDKDLSLANFSRLYSLVALLIAVFATVMTIIVIGYVLLNPLLRFRKRLIEASANPVKGYKHFIMEKNRDELGEVITIAETLLAKIRRNIIELRSHQRSLKKANDTLETKVIERTQKLMQSNQSLQQEMKKRQLAEDETRSMALFPSETRDPVLRIKKDGTILYANNASQNLLAKWQTEVGSMVPFIWRNMIADALVLKEGKDIEENVADKTFLVNITPIINRDYVNLYMTDISTRKLFEQQLEHLHSHDATTHLPNRILFEDLVNQLIINNRRHNKIVALLFFGINDFNKINLAIGHQHSESLLRSVSERLIQHLPETVVLARLAGSNFAIALGELNNPNETIGLIKIIHGCFATPFAYSEEQLEVTTNIGIAIYPHDGENTAELIKNADIAMYHARSKGPSYYQFFIAEMNAEIERQTKIINSLREAINNNELLLYFQPQHELPSKNLIGAELLLRWQHRELGLLTPKQFMPLLEQTDYIFTIGEWLIRAACIELLTWHKMGLKNIRLAVNLSTKQFNSRNITQITKQILDETGVSPHSLEFEITESIAMQDAELAIATMNELRALGIKLAIDDFGTEYSSLRYMQYFPVDFIKLDIFFVQNIGKNHQSNSIVTAIIKLCHTLGMAVIAEGVETEEQFSFLKEHDCDEIQGFYFSKPLNSADFVDYAKKFRKDEP